MFEIELRNMDENTRTINSHEVYRHALVTGILYDCIIQPNLAESLWKLIPIHDKEGANDDEKLFEIFTRFSPKSFPQQSFDLKELKEWFDITYNDHSCDKNKTNQNRETLIRDVTTLKLMEGITSNPLTEKIYADKDKHFEDSLYENMLIILLITKQIPAFESQAVYWQLPATIQLNKILLKFLNADYQNSQHIVDRFFPWFNDKYNKLEHYEQSLENRQTLLNIIANNMKKCAENIEHGSTHVVSSSWLSKLNPIKGLGFASKKN